MGTFPTLTPPPTPSPNRNTQTSSEFSDAVDNRLSWDTDRTSDLNSWSSAANTTATEAQTSATNSANSASQAASSASDASTYASQAAASSNFKGQWSNLSGALSIPSTVEHEGITYELLNNLADVTASEPPNSDWLVRDGVIPDGAIGNIQEPLYHLPLKNSLSPVVGTGSVTFNRNGTATHINRYDDIVSLVDAVPGYDAAGIDLPPASTNIYKYSRDLSQGDWTKSNLTVATSITGPDGLTTAYKLVESADDTWKNISQVVTLGLGYHTFGIIAKADERNVLQVVPNGSFFTPVSYVNFDLSNGTIPVQSEVDDAQIIPLTDGWYLCIVTDESVSATTAAGCYLSIQDSTDAGRAGSYLGDGSSGLHIWHQQVENLPFWTPPIYTTSAPATRNGATLQLPYAENFPGSLKDKTVIMDIVVIGTNAANESVFDSGDLQFQISGTSPTTAEFSAVMGTGNATTGASYNFGQSYRFGITYEAATTTLKAFIAGIKVAENTGITGSDSALSTITIGGADSYSKVKNIRDYDYVSTETEMRIA